MSSASPGSQVQISDLMESSFWEANKGRIGAIIVVAIVGVVGWQLWSEQKIKAEEEAWQQFRTGLDEGKEVSGLLEGKAPESWALFQEASRSFSEGRFDDAVAKARKLKERFPKAPFVVNQEVDRLLSDAEAESAFAKAHPEKKENPAIAEDRVLTIKTDAGEFQIGLYTDLAPTLTRSLLKLARDGSLKSATIEAVATESFVSLSIPLPAETKADDVAALGDPERNALRVGNSPSHFAGAVAFEVVEDTSDPATSADGGDAAKEKPKKLRLTIYAADATHRDSQSMTIGMVKSGLDTLKEISKRELDDKGLLKSAIKVTDVSEAAGLAAIQ